MTKRKAFLIHLGVSALIFIVLTLVIIYVWYPAPYFDAEYRMKWIQVIAFVDVVLGPGLTLLIFKPGKPSLKFDMSAIVVFQAVALSLGVWNAWSIHPVANVYFDRAVYCLTADAYKNSGTTIRSLDMVMPDKVQLVLPYPEKAEDKLHYLNSTPGGELMAIHVGDRYVPLDGPAPEYFEDNNRSLDDVAKRNANYLQEWQAFKARFPDYSRYSIYRLICANDEKTLVYDKQNNRIPAVLNIRLPDYWQF